MAGVASAIMAGAAVVGAAATAYGAVKKSQGVADNGAASGAITQEQINRIADQERQANDIASWYNDQNKANADNSQANSTRTIAGANAPALLSGERAAVANRQASGYAALDRTPDPSLYGTRNYSDGADDSSGAIRSENAGQLVRALNLGRARADAGAKVNGWGDALLDNGLVINRGNQNQAIINRGQQTTDRVAQLRSNLNQQEHVPILSPNAEYGLAARAGVGDLNTGTALQAGGGVISALGSTGALQKIPGYFNGLFSNGNIPGAGQPGAAGMDTLLTTAGSGSSPGLFSGLLG